MTSRLRAAIVTREYPPEVYGGAGVHVEYLVRALARHVDVRVHSWARVENSVLFEGVSVGQHAVVRNAIVDKGVVIPDGVEIGVDPIADRKRFTISDGGIVVIGKGEVIKA